jgi:hypothetical protein
MRNRTSPRVKTTEVRLAMAVEEEIPMAVSSFQVQVEARTLQVPLMVTATTTTPAVAAVVAVVAEAVQARTHALVHPAVANSTRVIQTNKYGVPGIRITYRLFTFFLALMVDHKYRKF